MNQRQEAIQRIHDKLLSDQRDLKIECERRAYKIKGLVNEQGIAKRSIATLGELLKDLNKEVNNDNQG